MAKWEIEQARWWRCFTCFYRNGRRSYFGDEAVRHRCQSRFMEIDVILWSFEFCGAVSCFRCIAAMWIAVLFSNPVLKKVTLRKHVLTTYITWRKWDNVHRSSLIYPIHKYNDYWRRRRKWPLCLVLRFFHCSSFSSSTRFLRSIIASLLLFSFNKFLQILISTLNPFHCDPIHRPSVAFVLIVLPRRKNTVRTRP